MAGNIAKTTGGKCLVVIKDSSGKAITGQRNATLNRSAETIDATSKDGDLWAEAVAGFKSWSIDCDGAWAEGDEVLGALNEAFVGSTPVEVQIFMNVTGEAGSYKAKETYTGTAFVTEFSYDLPYDDLATYSMTLSGNGPLVLSDTSATKLASGDFKK